MVVGTSLGVVLLGATSGFQIYCSLKAFKLSLHLWRSEQYWSTVDAISSGLLLELVPCCCPAAHALPALSPAHPPAEALSLPLSLPGGH